MYSGDVDPKSLTLTICSGVRTSCAAWHSGSMPVAYVDDLFGREDDQVQQGRDYYALSLTLTICSGVRTFCSGLTALRPRRRLR